MAFSLMATVVNARLRMTITPPRAHTHPHITTMTWQEMCNNTKIKGKPIDHSITLVGYGSHSKHGDYW